MNKTDSPFFLSLVGWIAGESTIESAVLFGSAASTPAPVASHGMSADVDLHVISPRPVALEEFDWQRVLPDAGFRFQAVRAATGGVRKVTALFDAGQIDVVIVPTDVAQRTALLVYSGAYAQSKEATTALNEMATCLRTGYRFLKGEETWGSFYARVAREMPGVRVGEGELRAIADAAVIDFLWVLQKLEQGELIAAQHVLHRQISETNLRLFRERRLRRNQPLPSFGLGRHVEMLATRREAASLRVSARLDRRELTAAAINSLEGLQELMRELAPAWSAPKELIASALARAGHAPATPAQ